MREIEIERKSIYEKENTKLIFVSCVFQLHLTTYLFCAIF